MCFKPVCEKLSDFLRIVGNFDDEFLVRSAALEDCVFDSYVNLGVSQLFVSQEISEV